ncbi:redox-sensitive transcriptional activator SoxR [Microbacterium marinilacus]|uniref:Redox-sensitive transcriptional activator SoxR n=1 Tax=Microbacterium marinilacus TaxID=415209 RepID=A0ABP7BMG8_9MICO|nr:redox-sensitive transcriptional activator SoxR [Microbacterium marinilacus]MBY0690446.1 redox-sensitive transcriptional activator SoxR [Microbacterium marinilacus]
MARETVGEDTADGDHRSPDELLTIGEMSRRTGVAVSALRFYERLGLIAAVRTPGNQRRYPRHMLRRVSLITVAKRLGIPLGDVQTALADVPLDRTPTHEEWQRASRRWKLQLQERREGIEKLERELTGCIGCGCLSMKACSLLNPDDELSRAGSGPRRLAVPDDAGTAGLRDER